LVHAEDWPAWRGPRLDGVSLEKRFPVEWSATENIAWKTALPGIGHSSPVVSGGRVFVTTCMLDDAGHEKRRMLLSLDRKDGKILWEKEILRSPLEPKHGLNSYSSATPYADGKHVYVATSQLRPKMPGEIAPKSPRGSNGTYLETYKKDESFKNMASQMVVSCYDFDGKLVWSKIPGQFYCRHGFCTTPIPYKETIILNADQDAEAYIVCLDKATGKEKWRINRERRIRSYCAPLIVHAAGRDQLILSGAETVHSYDPTDGSPIWMIEGPTEQTVASPVYAQGLVFLTAGFPTFHNIAIRPDGKGNVTKTHVAWHEDNKSNGMKASYVPSPIAYDKWFYVISDRGPLSCFEAKTGNRLYTQPLGRHHSSSPVRAGDLIYIPDDDGITYVVKGGPTFELVAKNEIGDRCYSSPALSDGQIFLRTDHWLFCIGK
jgi:outer membrane protein assembly factor BamB